jgi:hypothetical protein
MNMIEKTILKTIRYMVGFSRFFFMLTIQCVHVAELDQFGVIADWRPKSCQCHCLADAVNNFVNGLNDSPRLIILWKVLVDGILDPLTYGLEQTWKCRRDARQ